MRIEPNTPGGRRMRGVFIVIVLLALLGAVGWPGQQTASAAPAWHDTGLTLPVSFAGACFDTSQPGVLLANLEAGSLGPAGSYALDTNSGQAAQISNHQFEQCSETTGLLFATEQGTLKPIRFSRNDPAGRVIAHRPTQLAADGTQTVYSLELSQNAPPHLWASADGGLTWQERTLPPDSEVPSVAMAAADSQALVTVTQSYDRLMQQLTYTLYFSADGGRTWEQRHTERIPSNGNVYVNATFLPGRIAPVTAIELYITNGVFGSNSGYFIYLSADGGRSFQQVGDWLLGSATQLLQTPDGILRLRFPRGGPYSLARTTDGGRTWAPRPLPSINLPGPPSGQLMLLQAGAAPANLVLYNAGPVGEVGDLWYSPDSGATWQSLGPRKQPVFVSPYTPIRLLAADESTHRLYTLDLPDASKSLTAPVPATGMPNGLYFTQTGHNLAGPIRAYWETHGGLAQFGYPRTEAFREISPTNGQVYLVQYFERNRLEYHPENAGTPYEVLLGLLGTQLAAPYYAQQHGAFNHFADAHYPGGQYFPQTGHNLRNTFLQYWQQHGGLAIHGYPISEEFEEVSPTDGKTYVVQYFQRSRFEWHPENRGTPYEVLLGLLGNRLIDLQGWQ